MGFNFSLAVMAVAAGIAGSFDLTVFLTLLSVSVFMALVKLSLIVFYWSRY